jgi:tetratricopeptide (TPR) repeat protein
MTPQLTFVLLIVACFSIGTSIDQKMAGTSAGGKDLLATFLGEGRKMFANHFYTRSDVYFHSGYYPSMFDQASLHGENHLAEGAGAKEAKAAAGSHQHDETCKHDQEEEHDHDKDDHAKCDHGDDADHDHSKCSEGEQDFLGKPKDFMDGFRRKFIVTQHTHLTEKGTNGAREILPWLKLATQLDPNKVESYTVGAFWLRELGKHQEAEAFLREGLRQNPRSYELLFELGRSAFDRKDMTQARNLWELAFQRWRDQENTKASEQQDRFMAAQILHQLARLEARAGNRDKAISWLTIVKKVSPAPDEIEKRIAEVREGKLLDSK